MWCRVTKSRLFTCSYVVTVALDINIQTYICNIESVMTSSDITHLYPCSDSAMHVCACSFCNISARQLRGSDPGGRRRSSSLTCAKFQRFMTFSVTCANNRFSGQSFRAHALISHTHTQREREREREVTAHTPHVTRHTRTKKHADTSSQLAQ